MSKFIFVTGGVVSGLGKGITASSIGLILKSSNLQVDILKFDPYLNLDPGTMSPFEHGEVFVLEDGTECDLDLGHYERFLDINLTKDSSITAGRIYQEILNMEREGLFLGKNVQLIPHVSDLIQKKFSFNLQQKDNFIRIIEIGGSTGDLEAEIFLESFRQFQQKQKENILHIHLGYIPFLKCSKEYKTKPLQNSIRELLKLGLQPDIVLARYSPEDQFSLNSNILEKIALFSNLSKDKVIPLPDLDSIYKVPSFLINSNLKSLLENFLYTKLKINLPKFYQNQDQQFQQKLKIGLVAKYIFPDSYLSLLESLKIASNYLEIDLEIIFIDAEQLENSKESNLEWQKLKTIQALIIPGGFGNRGLEGKINAIKYAREKKIPFLGICLGLQMAVVEFARHKCYLKAYSREMFENINTQDQNIDIVIDYLPNQLKTIQKGGTMRLGSYPCHLSKESLAYQIFQTETILERHRHRLEVQSKYLDLLEKNGLKITGKYYFNNNSKEFLVEIIELDTQEHPYFIAIQSHPEFLSRPDKPHPLFKELLKTTLKLNNLN